MAAPWVSGTVALMFAAAGRPLSIHEIRRLLIGTSKPHGGPKGRSSTQLGYGYLNIPAAVDAARKLGASAPQPPAAAPVAPRAREDEAEWVETEAEVAPQEADDDVAWAPTWVEDSAVGEVPDEALVLDEAEREALSQQLPEATHAPCNCGCAHCKEAMASREELEEVDEGEEESEDEQEEEIDEGNLFALEDIREALESNDGRE
jgi:hypothetical protein